MPIGCVLCDSLSLIRCASTSISDLLSAGNEMFQGVLGSGSNIINPCHSPGHNAVVRSLRYQPRSSTTLPIMASFTPAEANETLWCPESIATSYKTPYKGMLYAKIPYSGSVQVGVGDGNLLPIANIGNLSIQARSRPIKLNSVLHVPQLKHNLLYVRRLCQ